MKPQITIYIIITTILSILFVKNCIREYSIENNIEYLNCTFTEGNILNWDERKTAKIESWHDSLEINNKNRTIQSLLGTNIESYDFNKNSIHIKNKNHLNISNEEYYIDRITGNLKGTYDKNGKTNIFHGKCYVAKKKH